MDKGNNHQRFIEQRMANCSDGVKFPTPGRREGVVLDRTNISALLPTPFLQSKVSNNVILQLIEDNLKLARIYLDLK